MATSAVAVHSEKVTHAVNALTNAGLKDDESASSKSTTTTHHKDNKKWIIVGAVIGSIVLIVLSLFALSFARRTRKRRAYAMVHRGVDMPKAPGGPGMTGGLMPLWMTQQNVSSSRSLSEPNDDRARRYSQSGLQEPDIGKARRHSQGSPSPRPSGDEMFDVDREDPMAVADSRAISRPRIGERNFESGYDSVDTGYEAKQGLMDKKHGDKRGQM